MRKTVLNKTIAALIIVSALAFAAFAQSRSVAFQRGIELFQAEDYEASLEQFKQAGQSSPSNVPVQLWLGLNYVALEEYGKPQDIWRAGIADEKWENVVWALKGLTFWKQNQKHNAVYYFKECRESIPGYKICRQLLTSINNDEDLPQISEWAQITGLAKSQTAAAVRTNNAPRQNSAQTSNDKNTSPTADAKPSGGLWRATISNGYKGQTLSFRVSADGRTISDITFQGYLQCRGSRIEDTQLAPLKNVAVTGGSFAETQLNGGAKVRFDFNGTFSSATSASGTYRVMSDTDCDTYKLNWTATRVGR